MFRVAFNNNPPQNVQKPVDFLWGSKNKIF